MGLRFVSAIAVSACLLMVVATVPVMSQQQQLGPRQIGPRPPQAGLGQPSPRPQGAPAWFPLEPKLKAHTDSVLKFWEFHSGKIQRYRCDFQRWEYDPINFHLKEAETYSKGKIKYAKPDKGLFEVTELQQGKKQADGSIKYATQQAEEFEKWICDGKTIFEFDHRNQQLLERLLPPDMQGQQIVEGPLPFLFGAKKQQIEERYWVRINPGKKDVFWLEAVPKRREDAANFRQIDVIIPNDKKFSPKAIVLHHRGGTRTTFEFTERESNWNQAIEKLTLWNRAFFNPPTPRGWKRVKQPAQQQVVQPRGQTPPVRQAQQPRATR